MFERFTDRARRIVVLAQEEARLCNHNYIGTEHLLAAMAHEAEGLAGKSLAHFDIDLNFVRKQIDTIIGQGKQAPHGHIPFTPRAKKVLELGLREALQLGHNYIGTEHLLLGLTLEGEGVGAQIIRESPRLADEVRTRGDSDHIDLVRKQVFQLLGAPGRPAEISNMGYGSDVTASMDVKVPSATALEEELQLVIALEDFSRRLRHTIENRHLTIKDAELSWVLENQALGQHEAKEHETNQQLVDLHAKSVTMAAAAGALLAACSDMREQLSKLIPAEPSGTGEVADGETG